MSKLELEKLRQEDSCVPGERLDYTETGISKARSTWTGRPGARSLVGIVTFWMLRECDVLWWNWIY